jgi:hypothetical protein
MASATGQASDATGKATDIRNAQSDSTQKIQQNDFEKSMEETVTTAQQQAGKAIKEAQQRLG